MKRMMRTTLALLVIVALAAGGTFWYQFHHELPQPQWITGDRQNTFLNGWIDGSRTAGIPYWIWLALPRMFPEYLHYPGGYAALDVSWQEGQEMPAGFAKKTIGYVRVSGNCALCHAASFRKSAEAVPEVVAAIPGHTLDIEPLLAFYQNCANDVRFNADEILAEVETATKLSLLDKLIYRFILIPRTRKALRERRGLIDPELLAHASNPHADPLFSREPLNALAASIKDLRLPHYPLPVDQKVTGAGRKVFEKECASCHADGATQPLANIGTDARQLEIWTRAAHDNAAASSLDTAHREMIKAGAYAAPRLNGIWLRGPYLHNGSVPTVADLLEPPEKRPAEFFRGNLLLDPLKLGFVSSVAARENQRKFIPYDTHRPGNGNSGHLFGTGLPAAEKTALLEYLKAL